MNGRKSKERARREATERRRAARYTPDPDCAVMAGHCMDRDEIENLKKILHDRLIEMMGDRRRSGVRWVVTEGDDARDFLTALGKDNLAGTGVAWNDYVRQLRARLREYGGWIVGAVAEGEPPTS